MRRLHTPHLTLIALLALAGCDYSIVEQPAPVAPGGATVTVAIRPADTTVSSGRTAQLRASVTGSSNTGVTWSIVSGPGRIYPDGLFVAPADTTGTTTVRARAAADTTKSATATIRIVSDTSGGGGQEQVRVSISPTSATILIGTTQRFTATVSGTTNTGVVWSVVAGGVGTIDAQGLYTAPSSIANEWLTVTVQATSLADPAAIGRATLTVTTPVDPNRICFERDIFPLLSNTCGTSACHDPITKREGYDFKTVPGIYQAAQRDRREAEIIEALMESDPDKQEKWMPPPPRARLSASQIDLIRRWLASGGDTTACPPAPGGCDTTNPTYARTIRPVLETNCVSCHATAEAWNNNVDLSSYAAVLQVAQNGKLYAAIAHTSYYPMPKGGTKLDDCTIAQFRVWIGTGAPQN